MGSGRHVMPFHWNSLNELQNSWVSRTGIIGAIPLNFRIGCNSAALRLHFKWRGKVIKIDLETECCS